MATSHTNLPLRDLTYEDYLAHAEDLEFSDEDFIRHVPAIGLPSISSAHHSIPAITSRPNGCAGTMRYQKG